MGFQSVGLEFLKLGPKGPKSLVLDPVPKTLGHSLAKYDQRGADAQTYGERTFNMKDETLIVNEQPIYSGEEIRTSSNNMMCIVTYEPLPQEQQEEIDLILQVAN